MAYRSGTTKARQIQHQIIAGSDLDNTHAQIGIVSYDTLQYPISELGEERYPHYTIFYFNETTKAEKEDRPTQSNVPYRGVGVGKSTVLQKKIKTTDLPKEDFMKSVEGLASGEFGTFFKKGFDAMLGTIDSAVSNTLSVIITPIQKYAPAKKRLKLAVCLPMPTKIRANYNAGYAATDEVGAVGATIFAALSGGATAAGKTALLSAIPAIAGAAVQTASGLLGKNVGTAVTEGFDAKGMQQLVSKLSNRVINKRQEQLFNNMDFRTHAFEYLFIPRSKVESDVIYDIIKQFKLAMHPDLADGFGNSILITPAEFDIEFRYKTNENTNVSRISTCALKSMDVNYTAIGEFVAFDGTDNPVAISLDMTFVEMEPLNKTMISKGY